jgi:hypothetical protein
MSLDNKRDLVKFLTDSKQTAELEEEMRRKSDIGLQSNQEDSVSILYIMHSYF